MTKPILTLAMIGAALALVIIGCEPRNSESYVQQYVLQGQMYVGHAPQIRLAHTIPLDMYYDSSQVGVSGADIRLTANADTFQLAEVIGDPRGAGYYGLAAGDTHTVAPGVHYSLRAVVDGDTIRAETRAAGYMNFTSQNLDTTMFGIDELVLHWEHDSLASGYYVIMENINPCRSDDSTKLEGNVNGGGQKGVFTTYWNVPHRSDSVKVPWFLFTNSGLHRLRVFTCDRAFWDYSYTMIMGQADYPDPVTNVRGALGLFCAGDVDTTYLYMRINPEIAD